MNLKRFIALSLIALYSSATLAISSGIRSKKDNECAIWLCLPAGFATSGCSLAHQAYISRVTDVNASGVRRYTDIPDFKFCEEKEPQQQQTVNVPKSDIAYVTYYEIKMPAYNTATRWKWIYKEESNRQYGCDKVENNRCYKRLYQVVAAVSTTPARTFESATPTHKYKTINIGQRDYTEKTAPYKAVSEVRVDGKTVGERYYR